MKNIHFNDRCPICRQQRGGANHDPNCSKELLKLPRRKPMQTRKKLSPKSIDYLGSLGQ